MPVKPASQAEFEIHVPLLVIGAGACGLVAALSAARSGVAALVLERDATPMGSTSLSAGLIPAANTRLQREKGITDCAEQFAADLRAKAHDLNDPVIVQRIAEMSGPTMDWLIDDEGLDFHLVEGFRYPGHSQLRMHGPKSQAGADLEGMLLSAATKAGIDILTEASVQNLYVHDDGRVAGVGFSRPDGSVELVGCDAVILACNGFGGNPEKVRQYIPEMAQAQYCGHESNTGMHSTGGWRWALQPKILVPIRGMGRLPHRTVYR
jgi:fumarate reductase flavoprotein subunit